MLKAVAAQGLGERGAGATQAALGWWRAPPLRCHHLAAQALEFERQHRYILGNKKPPQALPMAGGLE